jgi:hypothetical protein
MQYDTWRASLPKPYCSPFAKAFPGMSMDVQASQTTTTVQVSGCLLLPLGATVPVPPALPKSVFGG